MLRDRYGFALTTASPEARDAYVAGVDLSLSANHGVEEQFRRAIACDEGLAVAHVALARTLQHLAQNDCFVLAFNSPAAAPLYSQWAHLECAYRSGRINCLGHARQAVDELLAFGGRPEPLQEVA